MAANDADAAKGESDGGGGGGGGASSSSTGLLLFRGSTNSDVVKVLDAPNVRDKRLITLSDAEGVFSGWTSMRTQANMFNRLEQYFLLGGDWCCSSRRANDGRLYPYDPPVLTAPRW